MTSLCIVCRWRPVRALNRCRTCYQYLYRHGVDRPEDLVVRHGRQLVTGRRTWRQPRGPVDARFWAKVDKTDSCWLWTGALFAGSGYGMFAVHDGRAGYAHRISYEMTVGPIPNGLQIDHLCRVRACVNPEHLEPVTPLENVRRAAQARASEQEMAESG